MLEEYAVHRAGDSLHNLNANIPTVVHRLENSTGEGKIFDAPVEQIKRGDIILGI